MTKTVAEMAEDCKRVPPKPCPMCKDILVAEIISPKIMVGFIGCTKPGCRFIATKEHWDQVMRKLTDEEADIFLKKLGGEIWLWPRESLMIKSKLTGVPYVEEE
jgi:hypothetical protein